MVSSPITSYQFVTGSWLAMIVAVFAALLLIATFIVLRGRRWRSIPKL
jgi:VIT1/CCC1 family predicted Fe2+/Mn2+ transporter